MSEVRRIYQADEPLRFEDEVVLIDEFLVRKALPGEPAAGVVMSRSAERGMPVFVRMHPRPLVPQAQAQESELERRTREARLTTAPRRLVQDVGHDDFWGAGI